jgi:two-component system OmpR family sensor kinase
MVVLLIFFSSILYFYIEYSVEEELQENLIKQSRFIIANYPDLESSIKKHQPILKKTLNIEADIIKSSNKDTTPRYFTTFKKDSRYYMKGYFPYNIKKRLYLVLTYDITAKKKLENKVFRAIIISIVIFMLIILLYALFLSNMLLAPIKTFSKKLVKMNENILTPIDATQVPIEFKPLAKSINMLVNRIKSFLLYKKELFVGAAHELKTPLAVIKTRSQVGLIKRNSSKESFEKIIRENIDTVNGMNDMVSAILEFGRAEGAQFEKPEELDLIEFLKKKIREFSLIARKEDKRVRYRLSPDSYIIKIQPLLLTQIIQNLIQNAIRYTKKGGTVRISGYLQKENYIIKITDEGPGIDESIDIFAPFVRSNQSPGAGLGLFLVKSASDAIGGTVEIKNRDDKKGAVAIFVLPPYKE